MLENEAIKARNRNSRNHQGINEDRKNMMDRLKQERMMSSENKACQRGHNLQEKLKGCDVEWMKIHDSRVDHSQVRTRNCGS